jgi:hypothetical protein
MEYSTFIVSQISVPPVSFPSLVIMKASQRATTGRKKSQLPGCRHRRKLGVVKNILYVEVGKFPYASTKKALFLFRKVIRLSLASFLACTSTYEKQERI